MANKKVQIQIDTKATGNGAKQTEDSLNKAAEAAEKAAAKQQAAAEKAAQKAALEAEKAEKRRIASEEKAAQAAERESKKSAEAGEKAAQRRIESERRAAAAAEKEAKRASAIVAREEAKKAAEAEKSSQRIAKAAERAAAQESQAQAKASGLRSQKAAQVGLQVQDIAVQAQMGTAATTILAQQGSQLLGAFGPTGAIIGGILAIGSAATGVFLKMAGQVEDTGLAAEEMAEKLKDAFSADAKKQIDEFNTALELSANKSLALRDAELQLAQAARERDQSNSRLIDSQLKLDEAQIKYLASTGQIKNAEEALLTVRQKAAEATKQAEIQAAQNQITAAREQYQAIVDQRKQVDDDVAQAQKRLAELEAQQQKLLQEQNFRREQDKRLTKAGVLKEGQTSLESQAVAGQLDGIEKQIANLYQIIELAPARIEEISTQAITQAANVDAAIINAQTQIQEIEGKFQLSQKAQEITTATEKIGQSAQDIEKAIGAFEPVTQAQALAKESIMQAVSDGMITAQEQQQIGTQLQVLMSSLQTGQTSVLNNLQELIKINNDLAMKMGQLNQETSTLKRQVQSLQGIR